MLGVGGRRARRGFRECLRQLCYRNNQQHKISSKLHKALRLLKELKYVGVFDNIRILELFHKDALLLAYSDNPAIPVILGGPIASCPDPSPL